MLTTHDWVGLLCLLKEREPRAKTKRDEVDYPWWTMVGLALWNAANRCPLRWTALQLQQEGWPKAFRKVLPRKLRRRIPDASTLSRRWRSETCEELLRKLQERLAQPTLFGAIDGFVLPVGSHTQDLFAKFGGPGTSFQKAYKAVRLVNHLGQACRTEIASGNTHEVPLAKQLLESLSGGRRFKRVAGDTAYDAEELRRLTFEATGGFLLAPVQRRGRGPTRGRRMTTRRGPYRQKALRLQRTAWGKYWMSQRGIVERSNGWLRQWPHELGRLPSFIRGPIRTLRWVLCHEVLCSYRKLVRMKAKAV